MPPIRSGMTDPGRVDFFGFCVSHRAIKNVPIPRTNARNRHASVRSAKSSCTAGDCPDPVGNDRSGAGRIFRFPHFAPGKAFPPARSGQRGKIVVHGRRLPLIRSGMTDPGRADFFGFRVSRRAKRSPGTLRSARQNRRAQQVIAPIRSGMTDPGQSGFFRLPHFAPGNEKTSRFRVQTHGTGSLQNRKVQVSSAKCSFTPSRRSCACSAPTSSAAKSSLMAAAVPAA